MCIWTSSGSFSSPESKFSTRVSSRSWVTSGVRPTPLPEHHFSFWGLGARLAQMLRGGYWICARGPTTVGSAGTAVPRRPAACRAGTLPRVHVQALPSQSFATDCVQGSGSASCSRPNFASKQFSARLVGGTCPALPATRLPFPGLPGGGRGAACAVNVICCRSPAPTPTSAQSAAGAAAHWLSPAARRRPGLSSLPGPPRVIGVRAGQSGRGPGGAPASQRAERPIPRRAASPPFTQSPRRGRRHLSVVSEASAPRLEEGESERASEPAQPEPCGWVSVPPSPALLGRAGPAPSRGGRVGSPGLAAAGSPRVADPCWLLPLLLRLLGRSDACLQGVRVSVRVRVRASPPRPAGAARPRPAPAPLSPVPVPSGMPPSRRPRGYFLRVAVGPSVGTALRRRAGAGSGRASEGRPGPGPR